MAKPATRFSVMPKNLIIRELLWLLLILLVALLLSGGSW